MFKGNLYIISAPSGTGKSTLIQTFLTRKLLCNIKLSISHTTRKKRFDEIHGKHYFYISKKQFEKMIATNDFLEYAEVFGHYYGTSQSTIEHMLATGIDIFLDIDWQGAKQIRQKMSNVRNIFILPPSIEELYRRLHSRGQDNEQVISYRMKQAIKEISHYSEYDYLIINNDFEIALSDLKNIIFAERLRIEHQKIKHHTLISKLLEI
ncbi:guanylate kinase [Pantoea sp. Aalb]|uniref:guanylate kinase n=1 Tax=Pantoea sp. Aalb TaxID=2576762 RepID=UPI0013252BB5|nr:guanylate kinase [Pantoea sp. Aalb]MXP67952.1 guanylate kinase [Pantoea sp. Aalb]